MLDPNTLDLTLIFLRERIIAKRMKIDHVASSLQLAHTLTKPLGTWGFQELRTNLKVVESDPLRACERVI